MNVLDSAKAQVKQVVEKVTETLADAAPSTTQAITIRASRDEVSALFQDADRLSVVFGDIADVQRVSPDRMRWSFAPGGDGPTWDCVVSADADRVRFVDVQPDSPGELVVDLRDAPGDRGTEVTARLVAPAPGALTGVLTFKALYRVRALLQTGEVPTIQRNPSARDSAR